MANLRRRSRLAGLLVCLAIVGLLSADWIAAIHGDDDPICDPVGSVAPGSSTATSIGSGASGRSPEHCPICHWLRSLTSLAAHGSVVTIAIVASGYLGPDLLPHEIHVAILHVPARSPPAWSVPA